MDKKTISAFKILGYCCMFDMMTTVTFLRYFPEQLIEGNEIVQMLHNLHPAAVFLYIPTVLIVTAFFYRICTKSNLKTEGRAVVLASAMIFFSAALSNILLMVREVIR